MKTQSQPTPSSQPTAFTANPADGFASWYETPLTSQLITHVEDDMLRFIRSGNLAEEPMTDPERRAELIEQGATDAELDTERGQYRSAMQALRSRLTAFLAATEHLEGPVPTTAPTGIVREVHESSPTV